MVHLFSKIPNEIATLGFMQDKNNLISGLKKLAAKNLSNLSPHPLLVFFEYSHPPILERIRAINLLNKKQ